MGLGWEESGVCRRGKAKGEGWEMLWVLLLGPRSSSLPGDQPSLGPGGWNEMIFKVSLPTQTFHDDPSGFLPSPVPVRPGSGMSRAGCSTRGYRCPDEAVQCMPRPSISDKATDATEGSRDPAALQPCCPQDATTAPGQPQSEVPPEPPFTKKMLLLFLSPSLNRV